MENSPIITGAPSVLAAILFSAALQTRNVGVGVSNPQSKLSVNGTTTGVRQMKSKIINTEQPH